jgi:hypothetical protein
MANETVTDKANIQRIGRATVVSTHPVPGFEESGIRVAHLDNNSTAVYSEKEDLQPKMEVEVSTVSWPSPNQTAHACLFCKRA